MSEITENTNQKSLRKWLPAVLLVALIAAFTIIFFIAKPSVSKGSKHITVHVTHLDKSVRTFEYDTDEEFLRPVLCENNGLISGSEEAYGLWIKTVDGETADDTKQEWWGYSVNGETAMYGVEQQPVNDGDVIDFVLNVGY